MKFLLLLLVVGVAVWLFRAKRRMPGPKAAPPPVPAQPQTMLACARCGLHLPRADALFDPAGRPYCVEAHRLAGPR
jgi:uncharacterized protein